MCVHVDPKATQIAVLEGRNLIEHYVSRPSDDVAQIHGNIYLGKVQNVLPGMEAAFVDIGTPKNAVLYRGDVHFDAEDVDAPKGKQSNLRIEQMLKAKQTIICQVTKNPIGAKGARLTQEVSLPGRFVVLIPNSSTYGISKRLSDDERKRLRAILDRVKPKQHGVIVRTAAEGVTDRGDRAATCAACSTSGTRSTRWPSGRQAPALLYREPDMAVRVIREEFNNDYRGVVIDDPALYEAVRDYVASISPALADRVELFDREAEAAPALRAVPRPRAAAQGARPQGVAARRAARSSSSTPRPSRSSTSTPARTSARRASRRRCSATTWRRPSRSPASCGSATSAGSSSSTSSTWRSGPNRDEVIQVFRDALARDKTRTQVFDISELGLVRDDPQAHRRGPARVLRRPLPPLRGPRAHHRPGPAPARLRRDGGCGVASSVRLRKRSLMYAVIKTGGKQEKVEAGQILNVEKLGKAVGDEITLTPVLLVDGDTVEARLLLAPAPLVGEPLKPRPGRG